MEHLIIRLGSYTESPGEQIPYIPTPQSDEPFRKTRDFYGWKSGMTQEQSWLAAQGWWKLRADRAVNAELAIVVNNTDTIVAVAHVEGIVKGDTRNWILGKLDESGKYEPWIGKRLQLNNSRNPIAYLDAKSFTPPEKVTKDTSTINCCA